MIIHNVYFWLTEDAKQEHVAAFEAALAKLMAIDCIAAHQLGKPAGTASRASTDHSWDYAIHLHFDTIADHDAYQVHSDHDVFVDGCKPWWAKVLVLDTDTDALAG